MKTKPRNQRLSNPKVRKQQHLLEVTVRRDKAVSMRNRAIVSWTCKTIFFAAIVAGLWVGGQEVLRRFVWENPDYVLTDLRVASDGALTREQILNAADITEGHNLYSYDLRKARTELDQLPQVERSEIQRVSPNRIDIVVTERRPIAWAIGSAGEDPTTSKKSYLVDARGIVMRSKRMLPEYFSLPVISGVAVENFAPGQRVSTFEMQAALELVRLNTDNTRWQARNIDLKKGYCLEVTDRNRAKITFGLDRIDQQLDRLFRYLDLIEPTKKEIQTVNLMVERNTPITFAEPESEEPTPATPAGKPSTTPASTKPTPGGKAAVPVAKSSNSATTTKAATQAPPSSPRPGTPLIKPFRVH